MSILEIISIVVLCLFALTCFVVAIIFGAWWHIGIGAMASLLARAIFSENKKQQYEQ